MYDLRHFVYKFCQILKYLYFAKCGNWNSVFAIVFLKGLWRTFIRTVSCRYVYIQKLIKSEFLKGLNYFVSRYSNHNFTYPEFSFFLIINQLANSVVIFSKVSYRPVWTTTCILESSQHVFVTCCNKRPNLKNLRRGLNLRRGSNTVGST